VPATKSMNPTAGFQSFAQVGSTSPSSKSFILGQKDPFDTGTRCDSRINYSCRPQRTQFRRRSCRSKPVAAQAFREPACR
jgi:hypothetical protein